MCIVLVVIFFFCNFISGIVVVIVVVVIGVDCVVFWENIVLMCMNVGLL